MAKKIDENGNCALCGKFGKLSFEHVPPKAAFNNKPIYIQAHQHLVDESSFLYGKKMKSNKGFGSYTLCENCNNLTGDWYAKDFGDFAHQGMEIILKLEPQYFVLGHYLIKPLNVFKQILTMFMSADKSGYLQGNESLVSFILDKESQNFPEDFKIFLYSNLSNQKRMIGHSTVYDPKYGIQKWSEINFKPFGYLLAEDSRPAHKNMLNITDFCRYNYNEEIRFNLKTPYLRVVSPIIGMYQ